MSAAGGEDGLIAVRGTVVFPHAVDLHDAVLTVSLRDVKMCDAPSPLIARTDRCVSCQGRCSLPFRLVLPRTIPAGCICAFDAEVRRCAGRPLVAGDWLSVRHIPHRPNLHEGIEIPVERVR